MPGDVLVVRIKKLRLNRATAISDDGLVERALTSDYAAEHKDNNFNDVVWKLDAEKGVATLAKPTARLKDLAVPVRPMLGCVGVAPGFGGAPIRTGDSGRIGGNMDFAEIREGATLFLPVSQPGALLYVGDGHALQGDGELNGNALETSLEVEFAVDVQREKSLSGPRVENDEFLMAMGLGGSLDEAFREATSGPGGVDRKGLHADRPRSGDPPRRDDPVPDLGSGRPQRRRRREGPQAVSAEARAEEALTIPGRQGSFRLPPMSALTPALSQGERGLFGVGPALVDYLPLAVFLLERDRSLVELFVDLAGGFESGLLALHLE